MIMNCPAFIIIFFYNTSIIISVIKHKGKDFLSYFLSFLVCCCFLFIVAVFYILFLFYRFGVCFSSFFFFFFSVVVVVEGLGLLFCFLSRSCMQTYDITCFLFCFESFSPVFSFSLFFRSL